MPHALQLDEKHRDRGLAVLLVHVQEADDLPAFVLRRFPRARATVVAENTIPIGPKAPFKIPRCALLGIDGRVLAEGLRSDVGREIDRLIREELDRAPAGYGATPEIARGRALLHHEGRLAAAKAHLAALRPTAAAREDLRRARAEVERRFHHDLDRIERFRERGAWARARDLAEALLLGVRGELGWEVRVEVVLEDLKTAAAEKAIALDRRFESLCATIARRKPTQGDLRKLAALRDAGEPGPVTERFARRLALLERVLAK